MKRIAAYCLGLLVAGPALATQTTTYVALVDGGKNAGHQVVTRDDDGTTHVDFIVKDNGRGPELKETYSLAPDGTFSRYAVKGTSTFGAAVEESFNRDGDQLQWKSKSDSGQMTLHGSALYTPLGGSPATISVMIAALAARPDGRLPLIPSGTLTMRKVADAQVAQNGHERPVQLLALTGIGFTPTFVWATTDATPRLFAFIAPGFLQLIEQGWESNGDALEARQKQAEAAALVDLQQRLMHPLAGTTVIRNVRVFDSEHATVGPTSTVVVDKGRITAIEPMGATSPKGATVIDGGNRLLLPGLFDMHAHFSAWDGGLHMAAGITSIRDMGNDNTTLQ
ncbi:MAG TPA: amidohydrolase, partial [Luteimonas sp.]|nr:amidohydrolase [Luteimonas sp.]